MHVLLECGSQRNALKCCHLDCCTRKLNAEMTICLRLAQDWSPQQSTMDGGKAHEVPIPPGGAIKASTCWGEEEISSSKRH